MSLSAASAADRPSDEVVEASLRDYYASWGSVAASGTRRDVWDEPAADGQGTDPDAAYGWEFREEADLFYYTTDPIPTISGTTKLPYWNVYDGEFI